MEEKIFFNKDGITVSNSRFIVPGQTYAMSGVTSIRNVRHDPSQKWPIIIFTLGLLMLPIGRDTIAMGLIFIAIGIIWWKLNTTTIRHS